MDRTALLLQDGLLYGLMPIWLLAGFADYCCHRVQHIERSAGLKESALHLVMIAELGIGLMGVLLLEINAAVFALAIGACVSHELTMWWDLTYASSRRKIGIVEQWVHGLQQVIPWAGLVALGLLYPEQAKGFLGLGGVPPDWDLRLKTTPLPVAYLASIAGAAIVLVLVPFVAEYRRCRDEPSPHSPRW